MESLYNDLTVEKENLLPNEITDHIKTYSQRGWMFHFMQYCLFTVLVIAYTGLVAILALHFSGDNVHNTDGNCFDRSTLFSPAQEAIVYNTVSPAVPSTDGDPDTTPYGGNPSLEGDAAWARLLRPTNIRISGDELFKMNETSLPLIDGSGDYWGSLEVYHQLHCLKIIREYIALDYYPADLHGDLFTMVPGRVFPTHIDHCLEALRLRLTCQPDLTVMTYHWPEEKAYKPDPDYRTSRKCVDWDKLHEFAINRSFSVLDNIVLGQDGQAWNPALSRESQK
ncbi:hypothetical protein BP6252_02957 [Coleophoma cylindrospora]|uniref:Tat pathway signal sequence n=1 Tax=Coleophoma cylindrospora TaxID=1849047 RepID=A0A3D8S6A6_9HELO|nr:hypothetical protein BP6252_02957 [Coleophoma cylindrospora]